MVPARKRDEAGNLIEAREPCSRCLRSRMMISTPHQPHGQNRIIYRDCETHTITDCGPPPATR
jgi:hypothetical protein